jgi:acyl dehydratase
MVRKILASDPSPSLRAREASYNLSKNRSLENAMPPILLETLKSLKDFVGREIGTTDWFVVTQERIRQFAEATEDRQWIHLDPERARSESPYGATIAHGFLTLSLLSHFIRQAIQIPRDVSLSVNYGLNRVRFPAPVRAGSEIRARVTLQSVKDLPDCVEAVYKASIEGKDAAKPCCVAEWIVRYYS